LPASAALKNGGPDGPPRITLVEALERSFDAIG
jgi:hypothetical protein